MFGTGLALSSFAAGTAAAQADGEDGDGSEPGDGGDGDGRTVPVETVVDVRGEPVPENLALDCDGTLYFGITAGEVWEVTNPQTQQTGLMTADLRRVATLPGSVVGVEVVPGGSIYVASSTGGEDTGVWEVPRDGHAPFPLAAVSGFPNDVLYDPDFGRLLVTESVNGAVYEVPLDDTDPEATVWFEDERLDTDSFGANGLAFGRDGSVYVAVTRATDEDENDVGRLVRVPVGGDGSAGDGETYLESAEIFGADGITTYGPDVYVAANSQNRVVRVTPEREVETIAGGDDGLVFPSDVLFGVTPRQRSDLFVCNFANQTPEEGAILRAHPFADEDDDGDETGNGGDGTDDTDEGEGDDGETDEGGDEQSTESQE
ncbi:hypothetical protein SAMN04488124_0596 [Halogeometricum limi]|uniref:Sugar lactone lactonase YvrE n=2 Tax=Halogeometricum limi TaxID=555875 RepID=A0A1I6FZE7_9EURY|nr:hypothetical protein SAMN04488124_0596 [Halogeometricum limi]